MIHIYTVDDLDRGVVVRSGRFTAGLINLMDSIPKSIAVEYADDDMDTVKSLLAGWSKRYGFGFKDGTRIIICEGGGVNGGGSRDV